MPRLDEQTMSAAFFAALLVSGVLAYPIYRILIALKSRQNVSQYAPEGHQKKQGTPTMGGLIILPGVLVAALLRPGLAPVVALLLCFGLIGFLDDFVVPRLWKGKRGLGWIPKLLLQVLACAWPMGLFSGANPGVFAIHVLVVLFCANAYNFADGLDGLAGGLLLTLAPGIVVLAYFLGLEGLYAGIVAMALIGAVIPFLVLNAPPAKLFMGDVGALPIGAVLGWTFVELFNGPTGSPWAVLAVLAVLGFMLIAELVPVPIQIGAVKLLKRRVFPKTPIHHAFEHKGWPESRVTWTFILLQVVCTVSAVALALRVGWGAG